MQPTNRRPGLLMTSRMVFGSCGGHFFWQLTVLAAISEGISVIKCPVSSNKLFVLLMRQGCFLVTPLRSKSRLSPMCVDPRQLQAGDLHNDSGRRLGRRFPNLNPYRRVSSSPEDSDTSGHDLHFSTDDSISLPTSGCHFNCFPSPYYEPFSFDRRVGGRRRSEDSESRLIFQFQL